MSSRADLLGYSHCAASLGSPRKVIDLRSGKPALLCPRCQLRFDRGIAPLTALFALPTTEESR
jgi:hypothetical protein